LEGEISPTLCSVLRGSGVLPDCNSLTSFRVIDGADSTLDTMEKVPVNEKNRPKTEIKILNVSYLPFFAGQS
jgi:peptidyl-prolyl cis-trans isomerase-like 3